MVDGIDPLNELSIVNENKRDKGESYGKRQREMYGKRNQRTNGAKGKS